MTQALRLPIGLRIGTSSSESSAKPTELPGWVSDAHPPSRQSRLAGSQTCFRHADAPAWLERNIIEGWQQPETGTNTQL